MPHFLYTVILFTLGLWVGVVEIACSTEPSNPKNILVFLLSFLFALALTLSLPLYFYLDKRLKNFTKHKQVFRRSLKIGFLLSIGITTFMTLKAFDLINIWNSSLFLIPYLLIFWQELKKH